VYLPLPTGNHCLSYHLMGLTERINRLIKGGFKSEIHVDESDSLLAKLALLLVLARARGLSILLQFFRQCR
jgi:hypothetical protein